MSRRIAVYPGTFDPITVGHMDVAREAARIFDEVHVLVYSRPEKNPMFNSSTRFQMVVEAVEDDGLLWHKDEAEHHGVFVHEGRDLVVKDAREIGAEWIVKGLRMVMDYEYELQQVFWNERFDPDIKTIFIPSSKDNVDISSSLVRAAFSNGIPLDGLVPSAVIRIIENGG